MTLGEVMFVLAALVGIGLALAMCNANYDCKATGFTSRGDVVYQCDEKP